MTRLPNGPSRPISPIDLNEPPEEWVDEMTEDLPEEEQEEPVGPS